MEKTRLQKLEEMRDLNEKKLIRLGKHKFLLERQKYLNEEILKELKK